MTWRDDLVPIVEWALRLQDLRHRFLFSPRAVDVMTTPGLAWTAEASVVLGIYEAALGKGYIDGVTIGYEKKYPSNRRKGKGINPKRADLAFKDPGKGKNWAYVEVKPYRQDGRKRVANDIQKLRSIKQRSQRWVLVYRVRSVNGKNHSLETLLIRNFKAELCIHATRSFPTIEANGWAEGVCDVCLAKVL